MRREAGRAPRKITPAARSVDLVNAEAAGRFARLEGAVTKATGLPVDPVKAVTKPHDVITDLFTAVIDE